MLLALSFARPFINSDSPADLPGIPSKSVAIVIDQSASMQREGAWDSALSIANRIITGLNPNDALAIIGISDAPEVFLDFEEWGKTQPNDREHSIEAKLDRIKPTYGNSSLDTGILSAMEAFALSEENLTDSGATENRIHVISDFSIGSNLSDLAGREWTPSTTVHLESAETTTTQNIGIAWMGWTGLDGEAPAARIAVISSNGTLDATVVMQLYDSTSETPIGDPISVFAPSGQTQMIMVPVPADQTGPFKVQLIGDPSPFDNQVFFVQAQPRHLNIRYYGNAKTDDPQSSAFYLGKASSIWKDPKANLLFADSSSSQEGITLHIINRVLSLEESDRISADIENGDSALLLVSHPDLLQVASRLSRIDGWLYQTPKYEDALLGSIDFESPFFSVFAEPRYSDFSKIRFWQPHPFAFPDSENIRNLASFDDGSTAVASVEMGRGTLIVWGSDWTPQSSQWPLSSKFPAWLHNLARHTVGGQPKPQVTSFDNLNAYRQSETRWVNPIDSEDRTHTPSSPGIHKSAGKDGEFLVAINTPRREIDVSKIEEDAWEQLGVPLKRSSPAVSYAGNAHEPNLPSNKATEQTQSLWRWIIIATLAFLAIESAFAKWIAPRTEGALSR